MTKIKLNQNVDLENFRNNCQMSIVIILNEPYPFGMACANRIHLYAKGLIELGADVKIIIPTAKCKDKSRGISKVGIFDGVPYFYTVNSPLRSDSFVIRRINDFWGPIKALWNCINIKPNAILLVGSKLYYILVFKIAAIIIGAKYFREKSEVPYYWLEKLNFSQKAYLKITSSLFSGFIVITQELENFYKKEIKTKTNTLIVPIINEFSNNGKTTEPKEKATILYTGSLLDRKDGIFLLLHAIAKATVSYPNLKLIITGNVKSSQDYKKVLDTINNLNINHNIHFTGYIDKEKLNNYMNSASMLIITKPNNRQNSYNFSTKLAEYLATGTPVLSTESVILNRYLKNKESVFFAKQDSEQISKMIIYILDNPDEARKVGINGQKVAEAAFNYKNHCRSIYNFFQYGV